MTKIRKGKALATKKVQLKIQMLCTLQFSLILAPHSFLVRFLPKRSLSLLFTFPMAVEQALTQIGPSEPIFYFIISPFYFSSFLLF